MNNNNRFTKKIGNYYYQICSNGLIRISDKPGDIMQQHIIAVLRGVKAVSTYCDYSITDLITMDEDQFFQLSIADPHILDILDMIKELVNKK